MLLVNIDSGPFQPGKIPLPVLVCDSSSVLGRTILAYQCVNNKILPSSLVGACCPSIHRGSDVGSNRSQISRWKPSRDSINFHKFHSVSKSFSTQKGWNSGILSLCRKDFCPRYRCLHCRFSPHLWQSGVAAVWLHVASKPPKVNNAPGEDEGRWGKCFKHVISVWPLQPLHIPARWISSQARLGSVMWSDHASMHGSLTSPKPSASQRIPAKLEMFKKLQEITGIQLEQRRDLGGAETAKDSKK